MWRGAKTATEENILNVAFLRTQVNLISGFFDKDEVSEIWITFPDPHPRKSRERKRLSSKRFIDIYKKEGGKVYFVQLVCHRDELNKRVVHPSRKNTVN